MAFNKKLILACASSLALVGVLALSGCNAANGSGGVAATVNGTNINENTVTDYIASFRDASDLTDDEAWAEWLTESGMTAESVRETVLDYFVEDELVKQLAKENGVEVDQSLIDTQVETMRANYDTDADWANALKGQGFADEQAYRDELYMQILKENLMEKVISDEKAKVKDSDVLDMLAYYGGSYDGMRRSSHILFKLEDKETGKKVLADLKVGKISWEDAVEKYSTDTGSAANKGDVGWDALTTFVDEYADALSKLKKGQLSALVKTEYGYHIIKCTDVFNAPEEAKKLKDYPDELVSQIKEYLVDSAKSEAFDTYLEEQRSKAEININPMPSDVPYNVTLEDENAEDGAEGTDDGEDKAEDKAEESDADKADDSAKSEDEGESADSKKDEESK